MTDYSQYLRIAIAGPPKAGKSYLGNKLAVELGDGLFSIRVIHTDDCVGDDWSKTNTSIVDRCNLLDEPFIVEGMRVPYALRKGMVVDLVIYLPNSRNPLTPGQLKLARGAETVFGQWQEANDASESPVLVKVLQ